MREYENLIGNRYGKLVVKELLPSNGSGHRRWLCQCDCGSMHEATTGNLKNGHVTNCGCGKSPDLSGKSFGKLTVLRRAEQKITHGYEKKVAWECRCECGNIILRTSESLRNTKNRMCAECSHKNSAEKAFQAAGFRGGTQITRIQDMKPPSTNTSGCRGVYWHKRQEKWHVRLKFRGKLLWIGSYAKFEDAVKARQRAEEEIYGTFLAELE